MKQQKIAVQKREKTGRAAAKRMRSEGLIPAAIYGKSGADSITVKEGDFRKLMRAIAGRVTLLEVRDETGREKLALLKDMQRHPVLDNVLHVDFQEVLKDEEMYVTIPFHPHGEAYGVRNENGILNVVMHQLEIKCLPKNLPESIEFDVTELKVGDAVHVRDLPKLEGVRFLAEPDAVIASCSVAKEEVVEEAAPVAEAAVAGAPGVGIASPVIGEEEKKVEEGKENKKDEGKKA